jgi:hypothetical protein
MNRQVALFSLVFSSALYAFSIVLSIDLIWETYQLANSTTQTYGLSSIIDMTGHSLTILLLISSMAAGWNLFKREKYNLAATVTLFPVLLYLFMRIVPSMIWFGD